MPAKFAGGGGGGANSCVNKLNQRERQKVLKKYIFFLKKSKPIKRFVALNKCFNVIFVTEIQPMGCARDKWDFQGDPKEMLSPGCCRRGTGCGYPLPIAPSRSVWVTVTGQGGTGARAHRWPRIWGKEGSWAMSLTTGT